MLGGLTKLYGLHSTEIPAPVKAGGAEVSRQIVLLEAKGERLKRCLIILWGNSNDYLPEK